MIIKKKITKAQYCDILNINKTHFLWLFEFFIIKADINYHIIVKCKKIFFPILFIINFVYQVFYCLWNEGLKNIYLLNRTIDNYCIPQNSISYQKIIKHLNE